MPALVILADIFCGLFALVWLCDGGRDVVVDETQLFISRIIQASSAACERIFSLSGHIQLKFN